MCCSIAYFVWSRYEGQDGRSYDVWKKNFASDEALEGYEVEEIQGITRCNTEIQFATAINHYFQKGIFHAYQTDVRNLFMNKYETNKVKSTFIKTINDI